MEYSKWRQIEREKKREWERKKQVHSVIAVIAFIFRNVKNTASLKRLTKLVSFRFWAKNIRCWSDENQKGKRPKRIHNKQKDCSKIWKWSSKKKHRHDVTSQKLKRTTNKVLHVEYLQFSIACPICVRVFEHSCVLFFGYSRAWFVQRKTAVKEREWDVCS